MGELRWSWTVIAQEAEAGKETSPVKLPDVASSTAGYNTVINVSNFHVINMGAQISMIFLSHRNWKLHLAAKAGAITI